MGLKITEEELTSWMVPYGTLMLILMIFFVILYSYSRMGSQIQYERTIATLQTTAGGRGAAQTAGEAGAAANIERLLKEEGLSEQATVSIDPHRVRIAMTQDIIFDFGSSELRGEARRALSSLGDALAGLPNKIIVEGHTDNIPVRGGNNWELSAMRAFSVIKFLIEEKGFNPRQLAAYGYGEERPIADNSTPEGRAQNRRIEISIIRKS